MEQYQYLQDHNIIIDEVKFECENLVAVYVKYNDEHHIGLDRSKIKSLSEERCILQHEISHFETGSVYIDDDEHNSLNYSRQEYKANKRTVNVLLPLDKLKSFICQSGAEYKYQIAEEFNVTEKFVEKALEIYNNY